MDKAHLLSFQMVFYSLDVKNDPFRHCEKGEKLLDLKYHVLVSLVHLCILLTLLARYCFLC